MMRPTDVHPDHGVGTLDGWAKQLVAGKVALSLYRRRRVPKAAVRAERHARADRAAGDTPPEDRRTDFRGVYLMSAGPGSRTELGEAIESIQHFEGDAAKIVVVDDATQDVRARLLRRDFPAVSVLHRRIPSGGPPGMFGLFASALAWSRERFTFDVLVKMDTDALVTGPGMAARAAEAFAADPGLGMLGTSVQRADGQRVDHSYHLWVVAHERRWSPAIRRLDDAARANGWDGEQAHAGVVVFGREMLDRAARAGWLDWRPPWWTLLQDDAAYGMITRAVGLRTGSWGGPGEPIASGQFLLPIDKQQVLDDGVLAVHTVRKGVNGESEAELRAFFREARERVPAA